MQPRSGAELAQTQATPSAAPTPAYTDIGGVAAAPYIDELTQLQVFWPPGGLFEPKKPVLRREFARWLFHADIAIWGMYPGTFIHPASPDAVVYFSDVPQQDPDFTAIQGLHQAGVVLGKGKRFNPNRVITREQALAIAAYVDCGGLDPAFAGNAAKAYAELPWRDKRKVGRQYVAAIASCMRADDAASVQNRLDTAERTFGNVTMLDPRRPLTRAQAAAMIWRIGQQKPDLNDFPPRTAEDALASSPASATP